MCITSKQDHLIDDKRFDLQREICEQVQAAGKIKKIIHHRVYVKTFCNVGNHSELSDEEYDFVMCDKSYRPKTAMCCHIQLECGRESHLQFPHRTKQNLDLQKRMKLKPQPVTHKILYSFI
jgi:hypothetical protein